MSKSQTRSNRASQKRKTRKNKRSSKGGGRIGPFGTIISIIIGPIGWMYLVYRISTDTDDETGGG